MLTRCFITVSVAAVLSLSSCARLRDAAISQPRPVYVAPPGCAVESTTDWPVRPYSLTKSSVADAERENTSQAGKPFGRENAHWGALLAAMQPGDELYRYGAAVPNGGGEKGYVLVRGCSYVAHVWTFFGVA